MARRFDVRLTHSAARDVRKLPQDVQARVRAALDALRTDPWLGKALKGELSGLWSYRTGSYRLIYQVGETELVVLVIAIGHRRDIYERVHGRRI